MSKKKSEKGVLYKTDQIDHDDNNFEKKLMPTMSLSKASFGNLMFFWVSSHHTSIL